MADTLTTTKPIPILLNELDKLFKKDGIIMPVSLKEIDAIPRTDLRIYCHYRGMYSVVSHELCEFMLGLIGVDQAIEIGSGNGTLSLGLKIQATDSKMQERPDIAFIYRIQGQHPIMYPRFVEEIDGIDAIKKYKPETVVGSWITTKRRDKNDTGAGNGNYWAPDEEEIMSLCDRYIMVGNLGVHRKNRLLNKKKYHCKIHKPSCLRSKASKPEEDVIFEFTNL